MAVFLLTGFTLIRIALLVELAVAVVR